MKLYERLGYKVVEGGETMLLRRELGEVLEVKCEAAESFW